MLQLTEAIKSFGRRVFDNPPVLPFPDTLNIESSYACNLKCMMCPRHFEGVPQGMFSLEMFEQHVEPYIGKFKWVHLTGWGETLMNKDLPEIITRCRKAGVWVAFTTNGLLLKAPLDRKILETGVEHVSISCDADNAETYEIVRGKATFTHLVERARTFNALKREMKSETSVQWVFVMMRSNFRQLPGAVRLAADLGYDLFAAKHMETAITRGELSEALWNTGMAPDVEAAILAENDALIEEAQQIAEKRGLRFIIHPREMQHNNTCLVRPVTNLFIDYEGRVSSCCYLNKNDVRPYNTAAEKPKSNGVYGELRLRNLMDILEGEEYKTFQREWLAGKVPEACSNCLNVNRMSTRP